MRVPGRSRVMRSIGVLGLPFQLNVGLEPGPGLHRVNKLKEDVLPSEHVHELDYTRHD